MSDVEPVGAAPQDRNRRLVVIGVLALIAVLAVVALVVAGSDDENGTDLASEDASTTTSSTSSTTSTTLAPTSTVTAMATSAPQATTTAKPSAATTTAAPKPTIAPARCDPRTSSAKPAEPATTFYEAWRIGDRACADKLGTPEATNEMFALKAGGPEWDFQGCAEVAKPDPHGDCAFTYEGGSTHLKLRFSAATGWSIFEMYQVAD